MLDRKKRNSEIDTRTVVQKNITKCMLYKLTKKHWKNYPCIFAWLRTNSFYWITAKEDTIQGARYRRKKKIRKIWLADFCTQLHAKRRNTWFLTTLHGVVNRVKKKKKDRVAWPVEVFRGVEKWRGKAGLTNTGFGKFDGWHGSFSTRRSARPSESSVGHRVESL